MDNIKNNELEKATIAVGVLRNFIKNATIMCDEIEEKVAECAIDGLGTDPVYAPYMLEMGFKCLEIMEGCEALKVRIEDAKQLIEMMEYKKNLAEDINML